MFPSRFHGRRSRKPPIFRGVSRHLEWRRKMSSTNKKGGATSAKYGLRTLWVGLGLQVNLQNSEDASASNASC